MIAPLMKWTCRSALASMGVAIVCGGAHAQDAFARASLSGDDPVWVGQRVTVVVELLVPGYFSSAASFELPDPDGVLLVPPAEHPVVGNETIDDTMYTVQRHELSAWPMRAGDQSVPAVTVRFRFKRNPLDKDDESASVTTGTLPFTVRMPPGAEHLGTVISARNLEFSDSWDPEPGTGDVVAGAAFKRTITFTAPDVPGMVFPPFPADPIDGLGVYAKRQVLDRTDRGSLTGVRRDEITYVAQRPGQYTIPAARFTWYDVASNRLRNEELPAHTLNVVVNPALAVAGPAPATVSSFDARRWGRAAIVLALIVMVFVAFRSRRIRRNVAASIAPLRPVHLQPLNPTSR